MLLVLLPTKGKEIIHNSKFFNNNPSFFSVFNRALKIRGVDAHGCGAFLANRSTGKDTKRKHNGLDIIGNEGEIVLSPISGYVSRIVPPYHNDTRYNGLEIQGTGVWRDYQVKMFYVSVFFNKHFDVGEPLGFLQNLDKKYPSIINHLHIEVRKNGKLIDPNLVFEDYIIQ